MLESFKRVCHIRRQNNSVDFTSISNLFMNIFTLKYGLVNFTDLS